MQWDWREHRVELHCPCVSCMRRDGKVLLLFRNRTPPEGGPVCGVDGLGGSLSAVLGSFQRFRVAGLIGVPVAI